MNYFEFIFFIRFNFLHLFFRFFLHSIQLIIFVFNYFQFFLNSINLNFLILCCFDLLS